MLDTILAGGTKILAAIPFTGATWFIIAFFVFFMWLFARASNSPNSPVQWEHLLIDSNNNRASPYKVGFLIGMVVSTFIVLTMNDQGKLNFDIFGLYLTFLLGGSSWNALMKTKETTLPPKGDTDEVDANGKLR